MSSHSPTLVAPEPALEEFYDNVVGGLAYVTRDRSRYGEALRPERVDNHAWITTRLIEGFDSRKLDFLGVEERKTLTNAVGRFRSIAEKAGIAQPSDVQFRSACAAFKKILDVVRPDRYDGAEAWRIGKLLERRLHGKLPGWVRELTFKSAIDSVGEPAIWIWVEAEDDALRDEVLGENIRLLSGMLKEELSRVTPLWGFIRFRAESELREMRRQAEERERRKHREARR